MHETSKTIANWGTETFGNAVNVKAYAIRAQEELSELIEAIEDNCSDDEIASEAADVTILLHRLTGTLGIELTDAVDAKMAINRKRVWQKSGNGVGQHKPAI